MDAAEKRDEILKRNATADWIMQHELEQSEGKLAALRKEQAQLQAKMDENSNLILQYIGAIQAIGYIRKKVAGVKLAGEAGDDDQG